MSVMRVIEGRELNVEDRLQLLEQVGNFSITPASLVKKILKAQNISYLKQRKYPNTSAKAQIEIEKEQEKIGYEKEIIIG
jgi:hypothetical protein